MAMVHATIKAEVKDAFVSVMNEEDGREDALDRVADKIASAIENAIKSTTIIYASGLVSPPGTAGGPVTGTFEGSLK